MATKLIDYVRRYPDILDKLLSLWNSFDLDGLKAFISTLDPTVPYGTPRLCHRRYVECRDTILKMLRSDKSYDDWDRETLYLSSGQVRQKFSAAAEDYDSVWNGVWRYEDRQRIVDVLQIAPGERVLEIGIGTGNNVKHMPRDCQITGIDLSPEMLSVCRAKVRGLAASNVELLEMDAQDLCFDNGSFDKILCFYTLCCVADPFLVMAEIERVCARSGRIVVYDVVKSDIPEVAALQYTYRPLARELGAIYLEFCPPKNISYDSCLDLEAVVRSTKLRVVESTFLDPLRTATMAVLVPTPE